MESRLSQIWFNVQGKLFPHLEENIIEEPLTEKMKTLVATLELVRIENFIFTPTYYHGQPPKDRKKIARAFIAKVVYNFGVTRVLIDMLKTNHALRRICGWERASEIPHESSFSRAFAEFAEKGLANKVHEALVKEHLGDKLLGHNCRDSTAIEVREKPVKKKKEKKKAKPKRGRPKKGEEVIKEPTRLERQQSMSLEQMLADLPKVCDVGTKKNSKGYKESWIGYKFHIDVVDGQIPVSCLLTSASLHDSQAALPLAEITKKRVVNCYDLMDAAYDSPIIRNHSESLGHKPIIDINPRRDKALKEEIELENKRKKFINFKTAEDIRYNERSNVERVNARLKDEFCGRTVRVRGWAKVTAHLMFGILALTADQLLRLVI
jgi:hypothetical protein